MAAEKVLTRMDATLSNRESAADIILKEQAVLKQTITFIIQKEKDLCLKALMAIEVLARNNFHAIHIFIAELVHSGKLYSDSSSRRCLAKIYGFAIKEDSNEISKFRLNSEIKKEIIALSFLWLVSKEKTAVLVFSMQNLYELRQEEKWITNELQGILEKELPNSSAGYRSRGRKILRKLKQ